MLNDLRWINKIIFPHILKKKILNYSENTAVTAWYEDDYNSKQLVVSANGSTASINKLSSLREHGSKIN